MKIKEIVHGIFTEECGCPPDICVHLGCNAGVLRL